MWKTTNFGPAAGGTASSAENWDRMMCRKRSFVAASLKPTGPPMRLRTLLRQPKVREAVRGAKAEMRGLLPAKVTSVGVQVHVPVPESLQELRGTVVPDKPTTITDASAPAIVARRVISRSSP